MHTEGNDPGRKAADSATPGSQFDADNPGYEVTDVNAGGTAVFLAGLFGFVIVFFFFCFFMGRWINDFWVAKDGPATKWQVAAGVAPPGGKRQDLTSNAEMQQKELTRMASTFPEPRLDIDDGNQATADLHAREDLLLEHYSSVAGQPGTVRIPIERAMELIAQRGLPVAGDSKVEMQVPLTTGFARTGYEQGVMQTREEKVNSSKAEVAAK